VTSMRAPEVAGGNSSSRRMRCPSVLELLIGRSPHGEHPRVGAG